jgi:hypothetical protein
VLRHVARQVLRLRVCAFVAEKAQAAQPRASERASDARACSARESVLRCQNKAGAHAAAPLRGQRALCQSVCTLARCALCGALTQRTFHGSTQTRNTVSLMSRIVGRASRPAGAAMLLRRVQQARARCAPPRCARTRWAASRGAPSSEVRNFGIFTSEVRAVPASSSSPRAVPPRCGRRSRRRSAPPR